MVPHPEEWSPHAAYHMQCHLNVTVQLADVNSLTSASPNNSVYKNTKLFFCPYLLHEENL